MKFRKGEEVIAKIETYAKVIKATKDTVQVSIGKMNYSLGPDKIKKIIPEKEKPAEKVINLPKETSQAKYIKHLESELIAQRQTADAYRDKYHQIKLENERKRH